VLAEPCSPGRGEMQFTPMPFGPNSWESDLLRFTTPALATP
jgi:hypothetical protein